MCTTRGLDLIRYGLVKKIVLYCIRMLDTLIIGGGISGLFCALQLKKAGVGQICILEQKGRMGGRIKTVRTARKCKPYTRHTYDVGAVRVRHDHARILELIRELGLLSHLVPYNFTKQYFLNSEFTEKGTELEEMIEILGKCTPSMRETNTVKGLMYYLGKEKLYETTVAKFGYTRNMEDQSAEGFFRQVKNYNADSQYQALKCGMSAVIENLVNLLGQQSIRLNTTVLDWTWNPSTQTYRVKTSTGTLRARRLLVTIPQSNLLHIPCMQKYNFLLESVNTSSSARFYAQYSPNKNGTFWYQDTQAVFTDLPIRCLKVVGPQTGLVQVSYSHGKNSNMLNYFQHTNRAYSFVKKQLEKIFPNTKIPKPVYQKLHYWAHSRTVWRPNVRIPTIIRKMHHPDPSQPLYFAGDSFCVMQGWIEGALENCQNTLKVYHKTRNHSVGPKKTLIPFITRDEVAKHNTLADAWVIYNGHVFNITKFIPIHPGSKQIQLMPGTDMTHVYNSVGHSTNSLNILNKYWIGQVKEVCTKTKKKTP